jgi:hypothetical protein
LSGIAVLGTQTGGDRIEESESPGAVERTVGREMGTGGGVERRFGGSGVESGKEMSAAFFGTGVVVNIGEVVVERAEKKGPEASAFAPGVGEGFEAEEACEESLHGVLGIGGGQTAPACVGVERRPVGPAERGKREPGGGRIRFSVTGGIKDKRPVGGGEGGAHLMK